MSKWITILTAMLLATAAVAQQTYRVGVPNNQLARVGTPFDCRMSLYDPEVYQAGGQLWLWGQGGTAVSCNECCAAAKGIDSIWRTIYSPPPADKWTQILASDCPTLRGKLMCDHIPNFVEQSGPLASPSAVRMPNGKVYMAFSAGNADYERGRVNWGVITNDTFLTVYPGTSNPASIITPTPPPTGKPFCSKHGIGQLRLAYEAPFFYFILFYGHGLDVSGGPYSTLAYRINYDPSNQWGLGATRQILKNGQWIAHDGNLIFDYDCPTCPNALPVEGNYDARGFVYAGEGDLKWNPNRQRWLHIFSTWDTSKISWQESTSLESGSWSPRVDVDVTEIKRKYPWTTFVGAGLWHGDIKPEDGIPDARMYVFIPIHGSNSCGGNIFGGLNVAMATLDFR